MNAKTKDVERRKPRLRTEEVVKLQSVKGRKIKQMVRDVLIVEDNANSALILSLVVEKLGYSTFSASTAAEALEYCKYHTPRLVLMDLGLPDLDGIELTNRLKSVERLESTPFIAVTAHVHDRVMDLAMEAGCLQFVTKPFYPSDLMETVKNCLEVS